MKIERYHEEKHAPNIRFETILQTRDVVLHSRLCDEPELKEEISRILQDTNEAIGQLIRTTPVKNQCHG